MWAVAVLAVFAQDCTFRATADPRSIATATIQSALARIDLKHQRRAGSTRKAAVTGFIDEQIFRRLDLAQIPPAGLSTDIDFVRRIYLDLTGRLPSPQQIKSFANNPSSGKRTELIDRLINSAEFSDKWTMWAGDWLQNNTSGIYAGIVPTRNQFYVWIRDSIRTNRSLRDMAHMVLNGGRESATAQTGQFLAATEINTGPKEDSWDNMLAKSASQFLGLGHYDCLLCHNGHGHLDLVSEWGSRTERVEAQRMAALFTNTFSYPGLREEAAGLQYYQTPGYSIDTDFGNRPNRLPIDDSGLLAGAYRDGARPPDDPRTWRQFLADRLVDDPMFARNLANRLWKQMFGLALAEPIDALDPARLDPEHPPAAPWTLQASHPELLELLAHSLKDNNYDLRKFIRMIATSSAYQLSSAWPVDAPVWKSEYVSLFARHYPRRLDAEEVHDAIQSSTGVLSDYEIPSSNQPVRWAMQLPDTSEPIRDPMARDFLDAFYRGDRLLSPRVRASSVLQSFKLMNDPFILRRLDAVRSPVLRRLVAIEDPAELVNEMFLTFLSRYPDDLEMNESKLELQAASLKERAVEDLAWALINKVDFVFSF